MAFGNRWWLRVHHTKPSTLGWSVVVGLMTQLPKAMDKQPEKYGNCIFQSMAGCLYKPTTALQTKVLGFVLFPKAMDNQPRYTSLE